MKVLKYLQKSASHNRGASTAECAIVVSLLTIACLLVTQATGKNISDEFLRTAEFDGDGLAGNITDCTSDCPVQNPGLNPGGDLSDSPFHGDKLKIITANPHP
jgi:hypothetical protein